MGRSDNTPSKVSYLLFIQDQFLLSSPGNLSVWVYDDLKLTFYCLFFSSVISKIIHSKVYNGQEGKEI